MNKTGFFRTIVRISISLYIVGILFRIQHWPFGYGITLLGLVGIGISSYFFYSSKLEKSYIDRLALGLIPLWCAFMIARIAHLPYGFEMEVILVSIAVIYSLNLGLKLHSEDKSKGIHTFNWERNLFLLGVVLIGMGLFLKYQHLPYAALCLQSGIGAMIISYLIGMFSKNEELEDE